MHGPAVTAAVDLAFENKEYRVVPLLIEEMIKVAGGCFAKTNSDQLYERQLNLEEEGDISGVSALVDARILLVGTAQPQLQEEFAHTALWTKFFLNYEAENFGVAADALRKWASTGTLSPEEAEFIQSQAANALTLTQLQGYGDRTGVQLGYSELTLSLIHI